MIDGTEGAANDWFVAARRAYDDVVGITRGLTLEAEWMQSQGLRRSLKGGKRDGVGLVMWLVKSP